MPRVFRHVLVGVAVLGVASSQPLPLPGLQHTTILQPEFQVRHPCSHLHDFELFACKFATCLVPSLSTMYLPPFIFQIQPMPSTHAQQNFEITISRFHSSNTHLLPLAMVHLFAFQVDAIVATAVQTSDDLTNSTLATPKPPSIMSSHHTVHQRMQMFAHSFFFFFPLPLPVFVVVAIAFAAAVDL